MTYFSIVKNMFGKVTKNVYPIWPPKYEFAKNRISWNKFSISLERKCNPFLFNMKYMYNSLFDVFLGCQIHYNRKSMVKNRKCLIKYGSQTKYEFTFLSV